MRLSNVKMLLCWPSRMQIYGFVENHTFLEQFVSRGGTSTIFQSGGISTIFQSGGTSTIFSIFHGSLWLGKDKGSIMKRAVGCGTIHYEHYYGNKLFE